MLGSLFNRGWQSDSADTRYSSIEKMDSLLTENQKIFEELANTDIDKNVRHLSISKLTNARTVFAISLSHTSSATKDYATQAFAKLIGVKGTVSEDQLKQLCISTEESIPSIIQHAQYAELRSELIGRFSERELAEIVPGVDYTDTRTLIANKLELIDALEIARKGLKGKDKTAEKIIKEKIDVIHAQQKSDQENADNALFLSEKMTYLSEHLDAGDWRSEFKGQFNVWSQRWNEMDYTPTDEINQRYSLAFSTVSAAVSEMTRVSQAQSAQNDLVEKIQSDCKTIASKPLQDISEQHAELTNKLTTAVAEWDKQNSIVIAPNELSEHFQHAANSFKSVLSFTETVSRLNSQTILEPDKEKDILQIALNKLNWQLSDLSLTSEAEVQARLDELTAKTIESEQHKKDNLDKLHKRIHRLLGVTKKGNLAQARRELTAITKAIETYSGKEKTILDERLIKANEVVTKMADWNNFVTEPKYLELCESMEALVKTKTNANPDKLAKKIHALQEQWKGLGYSDSSETHWQRFKTAADSAYEPCAAFFKQRQNTRRENLAKREPFITQMRALWENTDWDESPDYKSIDLSVKKIMQGWQTIKDVEQGPGQKQWKKLTKLKSNINEKFDVVYDANIELKNQIIAQTNALLDLDVTDQTLTKLQLFQSRWKQIGMTRRRQDQAAWKKFKASSDAVYEKIQGLRKEVRAEEDAQINQYRDISKQILTLSKNTTNLAEGDKQFSQLQNNYDALPDLPENLPEKLIKGLALDYRRACDNYQKARDRITQNARSEVLESLEKKSRICAQLEQLGSDKSPQEVETLLTAINEVSLEDKALIKRFETRLSAVDDCDHEKAAEQRRKLCIDLEILLDVTSPDQDKALRMSLQLERMKSGGLGQTSQLNSKILEKLRIDWLCLPAANKTIQDALDKRYNGLLKKFKAKC